MISWMPIDGAVSNLTANWGFPATQMCLCLWLCFFIEMAYWTKWEWEAHLLAVLWNITHAS